MKRIAENLQEAPFGTDELSVLAALAGYLFTPGFCAELVKEGGRRPREVLRQLEGKKAVRTGFAGYSVADPAAAELTELICRPERIVSCRRSAGAFSESVLFYFRGGKAAAVSGERILRAGSAREAAQSVLSVLEPENCRAGERNLRIHGGKLKYACYLLNVSGAGAAAAYLQNEGLSAPDAETLVGLFCAGAVRLSLCRWKKTEYGYLNDRIDEVSAAERELYRLSPGPGGTVRIRGLEPEELKSRLAGYFPAESEE